MSSLTHAKKAALLAKVDESIGSLCPKRRHLKDAIRGGVLVDALYILLDLHKETTRSETKLIVQADEHEYTIGRLQEQLAVAKQDIKHFRQELEDARDALAASQAALAEEKALVAQHEKSDKHNHALYTKTRKELADARAELEEAYKGWSSESMQLMHIDAELSHTRTELHRLKEQTARDIAWYQQMEAEREVEGLPAGVLKGML
jgi:5-bromo-4-chloroindolyl phosphate hydrolysis protein